MQYKAFKQITHFVINEEFILDITDHDDEENDQLLAGYYMDIATNFIEATKGKVIKRYVIDIERRLITVDIGNPLGKKE